MTALTERFDRAMARAAELHRGQMRKASNVPYISHPMAVAALVLEHMGTEAQAIAALLHDVLEDTPFTEAELRTEFGGDVADIVVACSDTMDHDAKAPWRQRELSSTPAAAGPADAVVAMQAGKAGRHRGERVDHAVVRHRRPQHGAEAGRQGAPPPPRQQPRPHAVTAVAVDGHDHVDVVD